MSIKRPRIWQCCKSVEGDDLTLLLTAVLFHDSGFLKQQKEHERVGCDIAREYLPEYDYSPEQVEMICGMIMATKIPQTPHNKLEQIICDADLDYLGRDDFFTIGNKLYDELCMYGIISTELEWNKLQVRFPRKASLFHADCQKTEKGKEGGKPCSGEVEDQKIKSPDVVWNVFAAGSQDTIYQVKIFT